MADTKPFEENAVEEGDAPKEAKTIHRTKLQDAAVVGWLLILTQACVLTAPSCIFKKSLVSFEPVLAMFWNSQSILGENWDADMLCFSLTQWPTVERFVSLDPYHPYRQDAETAY